MVGESRKFDLLIAKQVRQDEKTCIKKKHQHIKASTHVWISAIILKNGESVDKTAAVTPSQLRNYTLYFAKSAAVCFQQKNRARHTTLNTANAS